MMRALELKVPPVVVAAVCAALMWLVARYWPGLMVSGYIRLVGIALVVVVSALFAIPALLSFKRADTTVNPLNPEKAASLVTSGVYRYSRNPMYVGILCLLLAWGLFLSSLNATLASFAFVLYMNRFQIRGEEAFLDTKFGQQYRDYQSRVRRWL